MTHWIDTPDALHARLQHLPPCIGLDTEFIRERTYWPQLALVQIALGEADDDILLVDPQVPGICAVLVAMLENPEVLKLMHSPSEDLVAFQHTCGVLPAPLFDTQAAAALCGIGGGMSYQKLVLAVTDIALERGETRSDWLRRPLSDAQLEYAADDVEYLFALHDAIDQRLHELGRQAWMQDDALRLLASADNDEGEHWPHLSMRAAQFLDADAQRRLLRLLRWRDQQARQSDKPRSWILDNELATTLARTPPTDHDTLLRLFERFPKAPRKLSQAVWQALQTPLPDEDQAPQPLPATDANKAALKRLQDVITKRGGELGLPDGLLASRKHLEALLHTGDWPTALGGWRREQLEPLLRPLLAKPGSER